jgi:hypothetical protein
LYSSDKGSKKPRIEAQNEDFEFPDSGPAGYVIDYMFEVGPFELSWTDLQSWNQIMKYNLDAWELATIKKLARMYVNSYREYDDTNKVSPFVPEKAPMTIMKSIKDALRRPV